MGLGRGMEANLSSKRDLFSLCHSSNDERADFLVI